MQDTLKRTINPPPQDSFSFPQNPDISGLSSGINTYPMMKRNNSSSFISMSSGVLQPESFMKEFESQEKTATFVEEYKENKENQDLNMMSLPVQKRDKNEDTFQS